MAVTEHYLENGKIVSRPAPDDVMFYEFVGSTGTIRVTIDRGDGRVYVMAVDGKLAIRPQAANQIVADVDPFR